MLPKKNYYCIHQYTEILLRGAKENGIDDHVAEKVMKGTFEIIISCSFSRVYSLQI